MLRVALAGLVPEEQIRRGLQPQGGHVVPDVVVPFGWCESKRRKVINVFKTVEQVQQDAAPGALPFAICRRDREKPIAALPADVFCEIWRVYTAWRLGRLDELEAAE